MVNYYPSGDQPEGPVAEPPPVVTSSTAPPVPRAARPSGAPKWETDARTRLRAAIQKYQRPLSELAQRDANEGDTRLLVTDFLCDALGFDKFSDLTTEYQVRGEFADYGVRVEKQLTAFIEVKRISTKLGPRHLRQVEMYAVNEGVEWMILTNGAVWQVWHLTPGMPVGIDLVIEADLLSDATPLQKTSELFYLTIEAMKRHQIDELWKARSATSPKALAALLRSPVLLEALRKELRRTSGHRAEAPELLKLLNETVIRPEIG